MQRQKYVFSPEVSSNSIIEILVNLKPRVYVRPCTKYPTRGIKACVAKQGDTRNNDFLNSLSLFI
ncbi:hypothetical protein BpHYR1_048572 [Brachionus plicatilis]|uniref:Uncharacterized protein n=1 Tax=Brachionus plicatilis TaxID=10195 RepID=A0A3M7S7B5_BRAPC|nr:hypothetical protein BpHYR1_048572 [Brachionus plicatilis]